MSSALAVVILILAAVLPTGRLALAAMAGLCMIPAVLRGGAAFAAGSFAVSGAAALLLSPAKSIAVAYLLFFGWYPIVKSLLERIKNRAAELGAKLFVFNAALTAAVFLFARAAFPELSFSQFAGWAAVLAWLAANAAFLLYDFAMTRIISMYLNKFVKK